MTDANYQNHPCKEGSDGTSQDAVTAIAPDAARLLVIALRALVRLKEATPLEGLTFSGLTREALQSCFSERRASCRVEPTGKRCANQSDKFAAGLRLTALRWEALR